MNKQHALSRLLGFLADRKWGWLTRYAIRVFIKYYGVNMQEAAEPNYRNYVTFNDFFTRLLQTDARPLAHDPEAIISPVDGVVSEVGKLDENQILQAKGCHYDVANLLGDNQHAKLFSRGHFLTAYLAPKNYHRIHMPIEGKLLEMIHVPGQLFSVNAQSVQKVPQLFARNERVICLFDTEVGPMAVVMVGAMIVGSISTMWHGTVTPPSRQRITKWNYRAENKVFKRGEEIGHFKLGSTVILLFVENAVNWLGDFQTNSVLKFGEMIGKINF